MIQMEADRLRENPQTPHQQETLQAITQGCTRLMRLLLAANNQATRRRKHKKLPSTPFNWVQAATDMHPACPNKKQNHLQNSLLRRTQFWVRKSFSKPASLKRASLVVTRNTWMIPNANKGKPPRGAPGWLPASQPPF